MDFLSNFYNIILKPNSTFERFASEFNTRLILHGILTFLLATAIDTGLSFFGALNSLINLLLLVILVFLFGYVFKLKLEDFQKILTLCCFAAAPMIFSAPIKLLYDVPLGLGYWLSFGLAVWVFSLHVIAISKACNIQKRKVLLFAAIPLIVFVYVLSSSILELLFLF